MFNSLRYTKVLEEAGVARNQAEAHVGIMSDMMASHFVTSNDMKDLKNELTYKIDTLRTEMTSEMQKLEYRMIIKLGTMMAAMLTIMTLATKLLN